MIVLGIETSCDETAIALYEGEKGILAHHVYSQTEVHREFGGVVPELASRDHIRKTLPLIHQAIIDANLSPKDIHGIAYTKGPGLVGALMVGASLAKSLAYAWQVPSLGLHHMESHLMAVMLETPQPSFPFLALLVSGGHTLLVHVKAFRDYLILGESLDDAAGEAFDKVAKLLGLPNPGGAALEQLAQQGNPQRFTFPRPMLDRKDFNFSFSGLKTAVMRCYQAVNQDTQTQADIACAFEAAVVDILVTKCIRALKYTGLNTLVMVGGVAANKKLRAQLIAQVQIQNGSVYYPQLEYCTDNGAMVAYHGWLRLSAGEREDLSIVVKPRWPMTEI